jgi:hypothetical protein
LTGKREEKFLEIRIFLPLFIYRRKRMAEDEEKESFDTFCDEEGLGEQTQEDFKIWLIKTKKIELLDRTQEEWAELLEEFDDLEENEDEDF